MLRAVTLAPAGGLGMPLIQTVMPARSAPACAAFKTLSDFINQMMRPGKCLPNSDLVCGAVVAG